MVYRYYGVPYTERSIDLAIKRISLNNREGRFEGNWRDCMLALALMGGRAEAVNRFKSEHHTTTRTEIKPFGALLGTAKINEMITSESTLIDVLAAKEPAVLICASHPGSSSEHAVIVVGLKTGWIDADHKTMGIISVDVLDPATESDETNTLSGRDLEQNFHAVFSKTIAQEFFKIENENYQISE